MSDVVSLARRVGKVETSPQFTDYSKVIIHIDEENAIEVGNDTGRTLEFTNPFGTQQMANDILAKLAGFQYQPYQATDALLDPAAEIGDAANMRGAYGGIYKRERVFNDLMPANIEAPHDEEIDHEYAFESPETREFTRQIDGVRASLVIANDQIAAKVSQTGGNNATFGWVLDSTSHTWYAGNNQVMKVSASGLEVRGKVTATSGQIGNFNISANAIWNNISSFGGTQSSGVYLGTNGIQLGQNFKVDTSGNVTATRLTVDTLYIGGTAVSAATLNSRANSAYSSTSYGGYCYSGAGYGYNYKSATTQGSGSYPGYFRASYLNTDYLGAGTVVASSILSVAGYNTSWKTAIVKKYDGTNITITYLGR